MEELPGVGANLQDHPTVSVAMGNPGAEIIRALLADGTARRLAPLRYLFTRSGMLAPTPQKRAAFCIAAPASAGPTCK